MARADTSAELGLWEELWSRIQKDESADISLTMLLHHSRFCDRLKTAKKLELFWRAIRSTVYLVRIEAVDMIRFASSKIIEEYPDRVGEIVQQLGSMLGNDPVTNTSIFEALGDFGALELPVTPETALAGMKEVIQISLLGRDAPDAAINEAAYGVISRIFEDLYQGAYYEAYEGLELPEKIQLLCLAASIDEIRMWTDWIISELLRYGDGRALKIFRRFAARVVVTSFSHQNAVSSFLRAVVGCAKLQDREWMTSEIPDVDQHAWRLVGTLLFTIESLTSGNSLQSQETSQSQILDQIFEEVPFAIADVLYQIHHASLIWGTQSPSLKKFDLARLFPKEFREIADHSLRNKEHLTSVFSTFEFGKGDRARFLIQTLGRVGDENNLELLRSLIDDPDLGNDALRAIRSIQLDRN